MLFNNYGAFFIGTVVVVISPGACCGYGECLALAGWQVFLIKFGVIGMHGMWV